MPKSGGRTGSEEDQRQRRRPTSRTLFHPGMFRHPENPCVSGSWDPEQAKRGHILIAGMSPCDAMARRLSTIIVPFPVVPADTPTATRLDCDTTAVRLSSLREKATAQETGQLARRKNPPFSGGIGNPFAQRVLSQPPDGSADPRRLGSE